MSEQISITAVGGCTFNVYRNDKYLGTVEAGAVDDDGQWIGDEADVEAAVRGRWEWHVAENATFHHKW